MMTPFLKEVADEIWKRHGSSFHEMAIVFPNKRQSVYFSEYLRATGEPPFFLPELLTIEGLVAASSDATIADPVSQVVYLSRAFEKVAREKGDTGNFSIETFFPVAETIINDFREIDSYFLDVDLVYDNLREMELLDSRFEALSDEQKTFLKRFWAGLPDKGKTQERFLQLWERLPAIYRVFHEMLQQQKLTTLGMCYRSLALGVPGKTNFDAKWQHIALVGFNAFNRAEETFLKRWQQEGRVSFWMDLDKRYLDDDQQEAGLFLRRNYNVCGFVSELPPHEFSRENKPQIYEIAAQGNISQAQAISQWWQQIRNLREPAQAAIILADETLLVPVMQSLPHDFPEINITMGMPMRGSKVETLVDLFFKIHTSPVPAGDTVAYTWVRQWLENPFCDIPQKKISAQYEIIKEEYMLQVPMTMLRKWSELTQVMFMPLRAPREAFDRLQMLLEGGLKIPRIAEDEMAKACITAAWQLTEQLKTLFPKLGLPDDPELIAFLVRRQLSGISIPLQATRNSGVQLMGLLESRGLDFTHILLLGAQEGSLPRIRAPKSFLPVNIRRAFGLPIPEHQDAIFAYVFYRLLHRSRQLWAVYNGLMTDNSSGEVSRYLQQIQFELDWPYEKAVFPVKIEEGNPQAIVVEKDAWVMRKMNAAIRTISPSAINTYVTCSLRFYFRHVAGLRVVEDLEDGISAAAVGKVVHYIMDLLYQKAAKDNTEVTLEIIKAFKSDFRALLDKAFQEKWYEQPMKSPLKFTGELLVVRRVVEHFVTLLLEEDEKYAPFRVESLEQEIKVTFPEFKPGIRLELKGLIDRVDYKDGIYRMVDYKTGSDSPAFSGGIAGLLEPDGRRQNTAALQTLIYAWMFRKKFPKYKHFEPALIAVRNLKGKKDPSIQLIDKTAKEVVSADNVNDYLDELEQGLIQMLEQLFDPDIPFTQITDTRKCTYCDFAGICQRN